MGPSRVSTLNPVREPFYVDPALLAVLVQSQVKAAPPSLPTNNCAPKNAASAAVPSAASGVPVRRERTDEDKVFGAHKARKARARRRKAAAAAATTNPAPEELFRPIDNIDQHLFKPGTEEAMAARPWSQPEAVSANAALQADLWDVKVPETVPEGDDKKQMEVQPTSASGPSATLNTQTDLDKKISKTESSDSLDSGYTSGQKNSETGMAGGTNKPLDVVDEKKSGKLDEKKVENSETEMTGDTDKSLNVVDEKKSEKLDEKKVESVPAPAGTVNEIRKMLALAIREQKSAKYCQNVPVAEPEVSKDAASTVENAAHAVETLKESGSKTNDDAAVVREAEPEEITALGADNTATAESDVAEPSSVAKDQQADKKSAEESTASNIDAVVSDPAVEYPQKVVEAAALAVDEVDDEHTAQQEIFNKVEGGNEAQVSVLQLQDSQQPHEVKPQPEPEGSCAISNSTNDKGIQTDEQSADDALAGAAKSNIRANIKDKLKNTFKKSLKSSLKTSLKQCVDLPAKINAINSVRSKWTLKFTLPSALKSKKTVAKTKPKAEAEASSSASTAPVDALVIAGFNFDFDTEPTVDTTSGDLPDVVSASVSGSSDGTTPEETEHAPEKAEQPESPDNKTEDSEYVTTPEKPEHRRREMLKQAFATTGARIGEVKTALLLRVRHIGSKVNKKNRERAHAPLLCSTRSGPGISSAAEDPQTPPTPTTSTAVTTPVTTPKKSAFTECFHLSQPTTGVVDLREPTNSTPPETKSKPKTKRRFNRKRGFGLKRGFGAENNG